MIIFFVAHVFRLDKFIDEFHCETNDQRFEFPSFVFLGSKVHDIAKCSENVLHHHGNFRITSFSFQSSADKNGFEVVTLGNVTCICIGILIHFGRGLFNDQFPPFLNGSVIVIKFHFIDIINAANRETTLFVVNGVTIGVLEFLGLFQFFLVPLSSIVGISFGQIIQKDGHQFGIGLDAIKPMNIFPHLLHHGLAHDPLFVMQCNNAMLFLGEIALTHDV